MSVARFIADQRTFYAVPHAFSCRLLKVSELWFYEWIKAPTTVRGERRALLDEAVRQAFVASQGSYGSPRVYEDLIDPELVHPELVRIDQSAEVVALPVHPLPSAEDRARDHAGPADRVQEPSPVAIPTATVCVVQATPNRPARVLSAPWRTARWCGGWR